MFDDLCNRLIELMLFVIFTFGKLEEYSQAKRDKVIRTSSTSINWKICSAACEQKCIFKCLLCSGPALIVQLWPDHIYEEG